MKRIGIFGGTFDPPHVGHLLIADEVKYVVGLDEIWFIPTNVPPHKQQPMTNSTHRYEMLLQATKEVDYFKVDPIELDRTGRSYTIDTMKALIKMYPTYSFHFIIGADMVEYLPKWEQIDELLQKVNFIGVQRRGYELKTSYPVKEVTIPLIEISSTEIKERIENGAPIQYFLPKEVYTYVKEHRLYGSTKNS